VRAVVVPRKGPPEVLRVEERPDPAPQRGDVRIAVEAAGLNFADLLARIGVYRDAPPLPTVLGYEVAGTVDALGDGVTDLHVGDRVMAATRFGGQAELAVAARADVLSIPDGVSMPEAAAIPVSYGTAYAALVLMAGVRPGLRVLIHSAAGGAGTAATQIASHFGAVVIGTASATKHDQCRANGAQHVIDYHDSDVGAEVRRITGGEGVDIVLNALGPSTWRRDWRLLRPGGRIVAYGASQVQTGDKLNLRAGVATLARFPFASVPWWKGPRVLNENRGFFGLNLKAWWDQEGTLTRIIEPLLELMAQGAIRPVVDTTFAFDRAADAHRRLMSRQSVGKVILTPH